MVASKTGAFCIRSCPFSSPSSSFTSKSLQSWTRNASRNASESGWKRSNRRSRKTPVRPRELRVAVVSGFPGTAGRVSTGNPKTGCCADVRERWRKMLVLARTAVGKAACGKCGKSLKMVKIEGFWTLRRESRRKPRCRARSLANTSARSAGSFGDLQGRSKHSEKQPEGVAE